MEKFDLFKAIHGHPLCTRDGLEVLEFHYFETCKGRHTITTFILGKEETYSYTSKGFYWTDERESNLDLMLDTSKEWIPTFKTGEMIEAKDECSEDWQTQEYNYYKDKRYYCRVSHWNIARPIYPSKELKITITVNGEERNPEDFSEETWSKLRK